jgi:2-succinyl-5-enolpyruvyl-6-hydroxy-3-cyclohexene-1-carboxylate synthase
MTDGVFPLVELAIQLCIARGVREFVIAPGSRSAPLTIALAHHPNINVRVVYDERSAGYVALGMAQQLHRPVGLVCTSGTAALNFGPAVAEAFYQQIPLLLLTADRPPEWIDQQDNQAIHQTGLYVPHIRYHATLPQEAHADAQWHVSRLMSEALDAAVGLTPGPVHINVPLREPLYPPPGYQHDITANCWPHAAPLMHADVVLGTRDAATLATLAPDLVIHLGGQVTSRYLKQLLRAHPPQHLWRVQPAGTAPDTYQAITALLPMAPADFLHALVERVAPAAVSDYAQIWRRLDSQARQELFRLLKTAPFGEFCAVQQVLGALPAQSHLQIGNSMPIRYANFVGVSSNHLPATVNANRGVSGIDGCVSTAVGAAWTTSALTTLIIGDLAFFYDRNGLWQRNLPPNLRIVLLNNHGGGIFDIIEGPQRLDAATRTNYFLTPQPLSAQHTALDHGLRYFHAASADALQAALPAFFTTGGPALLEIETAMDVNRAVFQTFRAVVAELQL